MPFSEALKLSVRRRAAFRCCRCGEIGVEIHHIVPQEDGGPDTEDNAAPLCPTCHENFGDNPKKRKAIREMRDHWYEVSANRWPLGDRASELATIKEELGRLRTVAAAIPPLIIDPRSSAVVGRRMSEGHIAGFKCPECGAAIGWFVSVGGPANACPRCGYRLPG